MRGNSKHGYHRHRSNNRYKKQIVRVLLDNSSDRGLVFVKQRQAHVASLLEKARFHTRGILRMGSPKLSVKLVLSGRASFGYSTLASEGKASEK